MGKMLNHEIKLIIVNYTLLSDITNRKPLRSSGAAYAIHFLFWVRLSVVLSSGNQPFQFTKNKWSGNLSVIELSEGKLLIIFRRYESNIKGAAYMFIT